MKSAPWKRSQLQLINFVADKRSRFVHDWLSKKIECGIGEIPVEAMVFFCPDTLKEAKAKGYAPCPHCLIYNPGKK